VEDSITTADLPDLRDRAYQLSTTPLRPVVDLRQWASRVEDQKDLGSCTGAAVTGAYEILLSKDYPDQYVDLSSLFVYYNARILDGYVGKDVGAYIRNAIKAVDKYGVCAESMWPYVPTRFSALPPLACFQDANRRKLHQYYRLSNLAEMLDALNNDHPVLIGTDVYEQFVELSWFNPILDIPGEDEIAIGAHALCLVGYDLDRKLVLVKNSFGAHWGMRGYFWMTFEYIINEVFDSWSFDIKVTGD